MRLSIITISYNNLEGLKKTKASIANIWPNSEVEWIVIDGGSDDGSKEYLATVQPEKHVSEKDKGIYDAMNKGLQLSDFEYVWFLNAGDEFNQDMPAAELFQVLNKQVDIVYSDTILADSSKFLGLRSVLSTRKLPNTLTFSSWQKGMVIGHQAMIVKKSIAEIYDTKLKHVADYNWAIEVTKKAKNTLFIATPIAIFDVSGHSSQNRKESNKERFKVMTQHFGWFKTCMVHLNIVLLNLALILKNLSLTKKRY
jgi:glycosyltransferase involved in cell wall biosynthesis